MTPPQISVVIPFYEGGRWLPTSAASVLRQEGVVLELIIVDDGSSSAADIGFLNDERVRLVRIEHAGKGAAINKGTALARGEVICVLDQDDVMAPGRLKKQLGVLNARPEIDAVYSDYERVGENGERLDVFVSREAGNPEMLHAMASSTGLISMQTMTVRKKTIERLGGFSEAPCLNGIDDAEFFVRLLCSDAKMVYSPGVAAQWVRHSGNYSGSRQFQDARLELLERLKVLAASYPVLNKELKHFTAHARLMRGLFFLENGLASSALLELAKAAAAAPCNWNVYYLLLKALLLSLRKK